MDLKRYKLGEIVKLHTITISPNSGTIYKLYSLPSFDNGMQCEIVDGNYIQSNKFSVPNKCILFNKLNVRFKRVWRINNEDTNKLCSTEFLPLIVDENIVDYQYLYYLLISDGITNYLCGQNTNTSGSHKRIDPNDFLNINVFLPSKSAQKQIGKLLSYIDNKINLNHALNQNLEAMAKQLYDYWFVQFDFPDENGRPYKSSGGEMVWNDKLKREIPKNWGVLQLDKLCSFRNGINYAKDEIGEPFPIVNVRNISSSTILLDGEDFDVITVPVKKAENYILTDKDIIIARSGCPGSTRLLQNSQKTLFCGFIICCTPYDSYMRYFLTYVLKGLEGSSATTSGGSILQNVSQDTLKSLWVAVPRIDLLIRFNKMIDNLLKQMCINLQTSKEMIKQRDELLPILMNGQVLVNSDLSVH